MEGWRGEVGGLEGAGLEGWRGLGGLEGWRVAGLEDWNGGRVGRLEGGGGGGGGGANIEA